MSKWFLSFRFLHQNFVRISRFLVFGTSQFFNFPWFYHCNNWCLCTAWFITPSGTSELSSATTKTDTGGRRILIGKESHQICLVIGPMTYLQVTPLGSVVTKHGEDGIRKSSVPWKLSKPSQLWRCNGGFGPYSTQNHQWVNRFVMAQDIPAEWLPVHCETKRPARTIGQGCRACAVWYPFARRRLRTVRQILDWDIYISWPARFVDCWGLPTEVCCTRSAVSADGPDGPVRFSVHRQPLYWNFLYNSRVVLSIVGSVWYTVRSLCCTVTIDLIFANFKTHNSFLPPTLVHAVFRHDCPIAEKPHVPLAPIVHINIQRFSTY
jgi:hypothetical protein